MQREIQVTGDGSHTLYIPEMDEHYHSVHGAIQESRHVFIEAGLSHHPANKLVVFEVGFGTGLNAWLTLLEAQKQHREVIYFTIEKYPLTPDEYQILNYAEAGEAKDRQLFQSMHECNWGEMVQISPSFNLYKIKGDLRETGLTLFPKFDLVYFDAFAPNKQEDLWNTEIYRKLYQQSNTGAIFVTYCAKGVVRRGLQEAGFVAERLAGPPGKHEMLRGTKHWTVTVKKI
jgi:tRNA U34 5-methylaminomethyl-2-thiouridine-forming methyltransferase MnmC